MLKFVWAFIFILGCFSGSLFAQYQGERNQYAGEQAQYPTACCPECAEGKPCTCHQVQFKNRPAKCPCGCGCKAPCKCGCANGLPCTCHQHPTRGNYRNSRAPAACPCGCGCKAPCQCGCAEGLPCHCHQGHQ